MSHQQRWCKYCPVINGNNRNEEKPIGIHANEWLLRKHWRAETARHNIASIFFVNFRTPSAVTRGIPWAELFAGGAPASIRHYEVIRLQ